jgi:predicted small metal-binding protein
MPLEAACSDAGFSCQTKFLAKTEEELQKQIVDHAVEAHGLEHEDFTPDLLRKIRSITHRTDNEIPDPH